MKFFYHLQILVFISCLIGTSGCGNQHENAQIRDLIEKNRKLGPRSEQALLGIKFGDSRTSYQKKIDSLFNLGVIQSLVPDSLWADRQDLSYYRYYFTFDDYDPIREVKWIFSPVFENNRLVELGLITTPLIDKSIAERSFDIRQGILKNVIDASEEVITDADITYRIAKEYLSQKYGTPEFVTGGDDESYWFKGNRVISVTNNTTTIKMLFKNSESK